MLPQVVPDLTHATSRLPDVGAPAILMVLALLGLLIFAGGVVAMAVTRRM